MKSPTLDEFKTWAKAHSKQALQVCTAKAFAQCEKERVNAYIQPIFESFKFTYAGKLAESCKLTGPIPNQNELYLCDDEVRLAAYYAECDQAHREHGFTGPTGHCPALTADHFRIQTENLFLREGCDLFELEDIPGMPADRKKLLDLLLGACLIDVKTKIPTAR